MVKNNSSLSLKKKMIPITQKFVNTKENILKFLMKNILKTLKELKLPFINGNMVMDVLQTKF